MTLEKQRVLLYVLVAAVVAAVAFAVPTLNVYSNPIFHENICVMSGVVSFFAGLLSMIRYYARRVCPYLWIGVAFLGNGMLELTYSYAFSFFVASSIPTVLTYFMIWGGWISRLYLSIMLFGACLTCKTSNSPPSDALAYGLGGVLLAMGVYVMLFVKLPSPFFSHIVARPLEYLPAGVLVLCLTGFFVYSDWRRSPFAHWLILSLIGAIVVQTMILPFSDKMFDTRALAANILRVVFHIVVTCGLLSEIFKLYRTSERESVRMSALRLAVDQIKDYALFMLDSDGNVITWNKGAQQIKGYTEEEIIGRDYSIFYPEAERRSGYPKQELKIALETGHSISEGWRIRKDGSRFWAYSSISPIYNDAGGLLGFSKITRDLTAQKLLEEELRKQNEMLTQSNEQLTQFAYIATHDLKEPLRTIASFTQLLVRACTGANDKAAEYSAFITKAVERTRKLIDDLRTYSVVSIQNANIEKVNLNQSLSDALKLLQKKVSDSGARINTCRLPTVKGSATQLMYLFLHMIDNAIKYAKPGTPPVIDVCCRESGTRYILSIKDNGVGIRSEYSGKLFSIFRKLENRDKTEGTGIGLSICKKVVSQHGGKIWYNSDAGGTTFYFSLPIIPAITD